MARIFTTGFEDGSLSAFTLATNMNVSTTQKRTGNYSCYVNSWDTDGILTFSPTDVAELYIRFGIYPITYGGNNPGQVFSLYSLNDTRMIGVGLDSAIGVLRIYRGYTQILTATTACPLNVWSCVELHIKIDDSTGVVEIKVNGVSSGTFNGDTRESTPDGVVCAHFRRNYWVAADSIVNGYYDDIAINDTTGSVNNSWIGQGGVYLCPISGAGTVTVTGMTPSTGSNYACVDEVPASDTDYVSSADVADIDLYTIDTSGLPTPIRVDAVKLGYRAKVDAGWANLVPVLRSESTTEEQTDDALAVSTSYTVKSVNYDVDPIDDAAWDATKLAALEVGQRKGL